MTEIEVCIEKCIECPYERGLMDCFNGNITLSCGIAADIIAGEIKADIIEELNDIPSWCPIESREIFK